MGKSSEPKLFAQAQMAHRQGAVDTAENLYRQHLQTDPKDVQAQHMLGLLLLQKGHPILARPLLEQAAQACSDRPDRLADAGTAAALVGDLLAARSWFEQAYMLQPQEARHSHNLGLLSEQLGDLVTALELYRRAVNLQPKLTAARLNAALIEAANMRCDDPTVYDEISECQRRLGRLAAALASVRIADRLDPGQAERQAILAALLLQTGYPTQAVTVYRLAIGNRPQAAEWHSAMLFALHFDETASGTEIMAAHHLWGDRHAVANPLSAPASLRFRSGIDRLRVGLVGSDFYDHSSPLMFGSLLDTPSFLRQISSLEGEEIYDRLPDWHLTVYSDVARPDIVTEQFAARADQFQDITLFDDRSLAHRIQADEIDVLIDLSAHTTRNRLRVFAQKPAPIQMSWVNRTGVSSIGWQLTDEILHPVSVLEDTEPPDRERPVRLPFGAMPFISPLDARRLVPGAISEIEFEALQPIAGPSWRGEAPVFGCFNNIAKFSETSLTCWADLLQRVPDASLLLKYHTFDDAELRARLCDRFVARGISEGRLRFMGRTSRSAHLQAYGAIDVALDTFPCNGGITSWEALWMGVPLVILAGNHPISRASASILTMSGLTDGKAGAIAASTVAYIDYAVWFLEQAAYRSAQDRLEQRMQLATATLLRPGAYAYSVYEACLACVNGDSLSKERRKKNKFE